MRIDRCAEQRIEHGPERRVAAGGGGLRAQSRDTRRPVDAVVGRERMEVEQQGGDRVIRRERRRRAVARHATRVGQRSQRARMQLHAVRRVGEDHAAAPACIHPDQAGDGRRARV
ncbi:hypothetical protein KPA97_64385, partial [Burkholderia cenocepacia]|nr:hypothetical protein [Burkholderia cenocepacia]MDR5670741.1 hypothetical protein [Burkholderia cenocepacia]